MVNTTDISTFWNWFKTNCINLHSDKYPSNVFDELDRRIADFGLSWEIGPGISEGNLLTISINGRRELLDSAKAFITKAPSLNEWEFDILKRPKENWIILEIPDENIEISAINWT